MKDAHKEIMKKCKKCIGQLAGGIKTKGSSYVTILSEKRNFEENLFLFTVNR